MGKKSAKPQKMGNTKSIADILGTSSAADPSLEALFKQHV
jgi:hypothetical protein